MDPTETSPVCEPPVSTDALAISVCILLILSVSCKDRGTLSNTFYCLGIDEARYQQSLLWPATVYV